LLRCRMSTLAILVLALTLIGGAEAQRACVVEGQTLQFCVGSSFGDQSGCACTDWTGERVAGFEVGPSFLQRLNDGLDHDWTQQSELNSEWLRKQLSEPKQLSPPSPSLFLWKSPSEDPHATLNSLLPELSNRWKSRGFPPGILPIGPWPPPPGWPPNQRACVVEGQALQFCVGSSSGNQSGCACTDWTGEKVAGFEVGPSFLQRLNEGLDRGWIQQSAPNSEWLRKHLICAETT
jgi:hypothetical protein